MSTLLRNTGPKTIPLVALQSWDTEILIFNVLVFNVLALALRGKGLGAAPTGDLASKSPDILDDAFLWLILAAMSGILRHLIPIQNELEAPTVVGTNIACVQC